eukprot:SM000080S22971  [mRNA]  locus=s80:392067:393058:- [translate_table: standard]
MCYVLPPLLPAYVRAHSSLAALVDPLSACAVEQHGGNKELISVDGKALARLVQKHGRSFFLSRTFQLEVRRASGEPLHRQRVLPRLLHQHGGTDALLNVTFIRAPPDTRLKVDVPLLFMGEDACPGIRKGGYLNTIRRTVRYLCPATCIPPHIEVDLSSLEVGDKILLKDLIVSNQLKLLVRDPTLPVCKVSGSVSLAVDAAAL